jgi:hypothetical protein
MAYPLINYAFITSNLQYVGVASGQKDVMLLGGNLPDSLSQHLLPAVGGRLPEGTAADAADVDNTQDTVDVEYHDEKKIVS